VLRVGLTGGIASGKSHVARHLARAGLHTLDLDHVAHGLMAPGGLAHADVVEAFGAGIVASDGRIDRRALARIVFADPAARERLNRIVHPRIRDEESRLATRLQGTPGAVLVVEAALLVESGIHLRFDRLLVAYCSAEQQALRLQARDGLDLAAVEARLRAQMPPSDKRRFAHVVIDTEGSLADSEARADEVARALGVLAATPPRSIVLSPRLAGQLLGAELEEWRSAEHANWGLDLTGLLALLGAGADTPWYAPGTPARVRPHAIAGFAALHATDRRGDDTDYAAAVAYSLARLTQPEPGAVALVTLLGLALHEALCGGAEVPSAAVRELCERWTGLKPGQASVDAARAAVDQLRKGA